MQERQFMCFGIIELSSADVDVFLKGLYSRSLNMQENV